MWCENLRNLKMCFDLTDSTSKSREEVELNASSAAGSPKRPWRADVGSWFSVVGQRGHFMGLHRPLFSQVAFFNSFEIHTALQEVYYFFKIENKSS